MWGLLALSLFIASLGSLSVAALLFTLDEQKFKAVTPYVLYLASGILLGAVFLGMIPKVVGMVDPRLGTSFILAGILLLFLLEKLVLWRSCENRECDRHSNATSAVALIGDAFHHVIDGIVITSSFLVTRELGVMVSLSIVFHEIPKSMGDISLLANNGLSRWQTFLYKSLSVSPTLVFGLLANFMAGMLRSLVPYVVAFSAASFLYLSLAHLIPEMHRKTTLKDSVFQVVLILLGIAIIYFSLSMR